VKLLTTVEKNSKPCAGSKSLGYAFKPAMRIYSLQWQDAAEIDSLFVC